MQQQNRLCEKLQQREAVIGIIGLGYVGLPLLLCYSQANYKVLGFDIDEQRIKQLQSGQSPIKHISDETIANAVTKGFIGTTDFSLVSQVDALIICVPTPLNRHREPDMQYITQTIASILPYVHAGLVISLESTTYPGTTEEVIQPQLSSTGYCVGEDIFLIFSPEREDPANIHYHTSNTPKVVGGATAACLAVGLALYQNIIETIVPVSSTKVAEMTKLLENIHRAVNIGLVNELKIVADKMDIDLLEVIEAAATKPFGFVPYYPGPGLGGHCIPIDPFYLTWKAREYGVHTRFIELAGEINSQMPQWVMDKIIVALNSVGKPIKNSKILVLGIAYKENVDDARESPGIKLMELLRDKHAQVSYSDPYFPTFPKKRDSHFDCQSVTLTPQTIQAQDAIIIAAAHSAVDYEQLAQHANLIIDTRYVYKTKRVNVTRA